MRRNLDLRDHLGVIQLFGQSLESIGSGESLQIGQYVDNPVVCHAESHFLLVNDQLMKAYHSLGIVNIRELHLIRNGEAGIWK
ncbi:hypothetical protein [Puniceibacterium confluentis]|uniref:hypothetical protein n=1 Tax=Puniceibacterium confluentis TaxID=1958944 RepID=UPI001645C57F|nr:hypothetical protein [Puniceibacterium confluentis]